MPASGIDLTAFLAELSADAKLGPEIAHAAFLPAAEERFGELDPPPPAPLARALATRGVGRLWSHQVEGILAARQGRDVLVTTPTASGKSLVFYFPVLEAALAGVPGRALLLFPLKALAQDQKGKLRALAAAAGLGPEDFGCEVYDGDTPREARQRIRENPPRVLITNPDMLHLGLLGSPDLWLPWLAELSWVVLDELHTYRGIFGSHFHHVLSRLLRLARAAGASPALIASSATAANPAEFAATLTGRSFHWIEESGAPREGRHFLLLRPAASPYTTTLRLLTALVRRGAKTIVFTKARRITELLYSWLSQQDRELAKRVASYRSGFLPEERRSIEARLAAGELDAVISTSALEMGIDVGGLDACVLVGFPGSVMATWQRSGRVGRAGQESLTALVALPDALDLYFLDHPTQLLERPCERLIVDPANEPVARAHLVCAAAERPLSPEADRAYLEPLAPVVGDLLAEGRLVRLPDTGELATSARRPQRGISLRGTGATTVIYDTGAQRSIGTIDGVRVFHECHPGAVYFHAGRQYLVRELDLAARRVLVEAARVDYYTTPLSEKETEILEVMEELSQPPLEGRLGRLKVTERVMGYERKRLGSQELLGADPLELPSSSFETVGLWWQVPRALEETLRLAGRHFLGALHASEHAGISLCPLLALCDRGDIGGISYPYQPQVGSGAVFIYDGHPGGIGIAARIFGDLPGLLSRVIELIEGCPCEEGCPSCIQSPKCGNGNRPLDKQGASRVLGLLLGRELPPREAILAAERPLRRPETSPRRPEIGGPLVVPVPPGPASEPAAVAIRKAPASPARKRSAEVESTVLFDLETLRSADEVGGWGKAHRMGVAVGVVCQLEEGRFETFDETEVRELVERLRSADLVVGFNVKRFDYKVLAGYTGEDYNRLLPTLDLLEEVYAKLGFRIGMGDLATATLGVGKSADGLQSLAWVKEGRLDLVADYCRHDVEILRDLYLFGRREGYLLYDDRRAGRSRLPVDW